MADRSQISPQLERFIAGTAKATIILDRDGTAIFLNAAMATLANVDLEACIGQPIDQLFPHQASLIKGHVEWVLFKGEPLSDVVIQTSNRDDTEVSSVRAFYFPLQLDDALPPVVGCTVLAEGARIKLKSELAQERRFTATLGRAARQVMILEDPSEGIEQVLGQLGKALELDQVAVYQFDDESAETFSMTYEWCGPAGQRFKNWFQNCRSKDFPLITGSGSDRREVVYQRLSDMPSKPDRLALTNGGVRSVAVLPILIAKRYFGAVSFVTRRREREWTKPLLGQLRVVTELVASGLHRLQNERLQKRLKDAAAQALQTDRDVLRREVRQKYNPDDMVGLSGGLREVADLVARVAPTTTNVLIIGETGTGKELVAAAIHEDSARNDRSMVKINCAAIAPGLIESELFGHEKGAFTSADSSRIGLFELADGGSLFLDEIGELGPDLQAKLLRVLQDGQFLRVGGNALRTVDVRIIAATNRDLVAEVAAGRFREDLYYRLSVFPLHLPPLRERPEDIESLARHFMQIQRERHGATGHRLTDAAIEKLRSYRWPGNVRELQNVIERAAILAEAEMIDADEILLAATDTRRRLARGTLASLERAYILDVLAETHWTVGGENGAAVRLGLHPSTLRSKMKKLKIERPIESAKR